MGGGGKFCLDQGIRVKRTVLKKTIENNRKQGNSVARDLLPTGSEANTTIFVLYILDIFPLSLSTIWGNHLPVNFVLKFPTCIYDLEKPPPI